IASGSGWSGFEESACRKSGDDMDDSARRRLRRQFQWHLEALRAAGVEFVGKPRPGSTRGDGQPDASERAPFDSMSSASVGGNLFNSAADVPEAPEVRRQALALLAEQVSRCDRCKELFATRTQTVFGVGPVAPALCFVGEAPGGDEDRL